jgi:hypothetical protein
MKLMILIRANDYVHATNTIKLFHQRAKDHPTSGGEGPPSLELVIILDV